MGTCRAATPRPALVASVAARGLPSATACTATALSTARASTARTARRAGLRHRARVRFLPARHRRRGLVLLLQAAPPVQMRAGALGPLCTLQGSVRPGLWHRLRQAPRRARCMPSARLAAARLPPPCVGPLPPFQPSLSHASPPTFRQRGAFAAADERAKGTVHFSDNDKKFGKKGRGRKGKGRAREIQLTNMRNAL